MLEILILRALALQAQGDCTAALADLERALALAAPEGYVRVFVDEGAPMATLLHTFSGQPSATSFRPYIERLFAAFSEDVVVLPSVPIQNEPEPLTEREREVLRLLAAGQSNQAIAQELVVAVGTVKRHVNNILNKLHVQSRLQAVARARDLDLV